MASRPLTGSPANALRFVWRIAREGSTASAIFTNVLVRIAIVLVTSGTGIIVARTLAPVGRGEQAALALWPGLLSGLATFGIPLALGFQSRQRPQDANHLFGAALLLALAAGSLAAIVGIIGMPLFLHGYSPSSLISARWLMTFAPQFLVLYVVRAFLEASGEFTRSILGQLLPCLVTFAALIVLHAAGTLTPMSAVLCYFIPGAAWTVWTIYLLRSRIIFEAHALTRDARALLQYGVRSYGTDVINTLSTQLDLAVIVAFLTPVSLGLYSVALTLGRLLNLIQQSFVTVIFPKASGLEVDAAVELIARSARLSLAVSFALSCVLLLIVPVALPLVYGNAFSAALSIIPFLMGEALLTGISGVLHQAFLCTGKPTVVTAIQAAWLTCALSLMVILVPRMDITGAAVALLAAAIFRFALVWLSYRIVLRRPLPRVLPNVDDIGLIRTRVRAAIRSRQANG